MFKSLGVYIPFSILVEKCWWHMGNRRHPLVQVQKILTELGISSTAFQASADELHRLRPPFFCLIGKAGEAVLSVVLEVEGDVVFFDQGFAEMRSLPMCDVQPLWSDLAVVPKPTKREIDSITRCSRTNDERRLSYFLSNLSVESGFLLPADCENIIEEASTRFNRSIVGHKYRISESRTSYSANLMGIVPHIYRKIYRNCSPR
jgi:ABC-type bacteriocin/lantibiotic exporter with double-glycine peptidase domain